MSTTIQSDGITWCAKVGASVRYSTQQLTKQQIMDLMSAKKEIVVRSKKEPKKMLYLNVDKEGEVNISGTFIQGASGWCYRNGSEIALPGPSSPPEPKQSTKTKNNLTNTIMSTKKAAVKKSTVKVEGKKVNVSIKDMRAGIKKGFVYRDPQGVKQTEKYLATRANQEYVREGMFVSKEVKA